MAKRAVRDRAPIPLPQTLPPIHPPMKIAAEVATAAAPPVSSAKMTHHHPTLPPVSPAVKVRPASVTSVAVSKSQQKRQQQHPVPQPHPQHLFTSSPLSRVSRQHRNADPSPQLRRYIRQPLPPPGTRDAGKRASSVPLRLRLLRHLHALSIQRLRCSRGQVQKKVASGECRCRPLS